MTDKALEAALLACPFCGGRAVVANVLTFVGVECGECGADIGCNPSSYPQDQRGPETWITEAIAAWNRRAPTGIMPTLTAEQREAVLSETDDPAVGDLALSALPGEAEVAGAPLVPPIRENPEVPAWLQMNNLFTTHRINPPPTRLRDELVTFMEWAWYGQKLQASRQAMQARAEKAERERDEAEEAENEAKDCFWAIYPRYLEMGGDPISTEVARTNLAARAETAEARVKELEEALEQVEADCHSTIERYERNGPSFTSPNGDHYEPTSFVVDKLSELSNTARTALKGGSNG